MPHYSGRETMIRAPLAVMDQNNRPSTPELTHDDSMKRLRFLERALAMEREKVNFLRAQQQQQQQHHHHQQRNREHHASTPPFRSPQLGRQGLRRVNSVRSTTSLNSVSTPIITLADMDKTGTVQAFAEQKDRELFRQFHPRHEHRSTTRGTISRDSSSSGSSSSGSGVTADGDNDSGPTISARAVMSALKEQHGLNDSDPRLVTLWRELGTRSRLTFSAFKAVKGNCVLMERALTGNLIIPDFRAFANAIDDCYRECAPDLPEPEDKLPSHRPNLNGDVARYIPSLAKVDPGLYGVAVCSVDGQQHAIGDASAPFCIQSTSKPLTYGIALELHGEKKVHEHVGCEPSGRNFNARSMLSKPVPPAAQKTDAHGAPIATQGIPHNPCINAGAIMVAALVQHGLSASVEHHGEDARFDFVTDVWRRLAGGRKIGFQNSTYMGERATADRNFCLA